MSENKLYVDLDEWNNLVKDRDALKAEIHCRILFEEQESIRHANCSKSETGNSTYVSRLEQDRDCWKALALKGREALGNILLMSDGPSCQSIAKETLALFDEATKGK